MHKAGFVNIIGNPNVGKSTLMNALVGEKLSIVTAKAQTTRHRIMGIVSGEDFQIVYSDTPGILKPNYRLQENMLAFVDTAIGDADIILYVTDTIEKADKNEAYIEKLKKVECPVVVVINKIDVSTQEKVLELMAWWKEQLPKAEIIPASAQEKFNLESILEAVSSRLPEAPAWFDKDQFTDKNLRFFASEIIREKIFLNYSEEIPYSCQVEIEAFHEGEDRYEISAVIHGEHGMQHATLNGFEAVYDMGDGAVQNGVGRVVQIPFLEHAGEFELAGVTAQEFVKFSRSSSVFTQLFFLFLSFDVFPIFSHN